MPEILLLVLTILLLPILPGKFVWAPIVLLLVIPGTYAMRRGPPYVPTPRKRLQTMITFAGITRGERVYDLGCGDGRLVIAAARKGARAIGYELSVPLFLFATIRSLFQRNATIRFGNFWTKDFSSADVIFCYLLIDAMQNLEKTLWPTLKPGCRVISNTFRMKGVKPAKEENGVVMYVK